MLVNEIQKLNARSPSYKPKTKNMKKKDIIGLQRYNQSKINVKEQDNTEKGN